MAKFIIMLMTLSVFYFISSASGAEVPNIFCYYDSRSIIRETQGKMLPADLDPALSICTHLIYGYAGININSNQLVSLNEKLDLDKGQANFRVVTQLKRRYPGLKVLLSVGGDADKEEENTYKYNTLIESPTARTSFINSASTLLKSYGFDGLELAWQFPKIKPKKVRGTINKAWHGFKKLFSGDQIVDEKSQEHKEQFGKFVLELKNILRHDNLLLTTRVLPNVNSSLYYDVNAIKNHIDYVVLDSFDFYTPNRNPKEADYPAPTQAVLNRDPEANIEFQVTTWLKDGLAPSKLVLDMPAYGRAWKLDSESSIAGVPPIQTDGPAPAGTYSNIEGVLSYPEICGKLSNNNNNKLRKVTDPSKRFGTYAFRVPNSNGEDGLWVGYEDPETAGIKAVYVRSKGLGGIGLNDLSMDDFRGLCLGDKFPILKGIKNRL